MELAYGCLEEQNLRRTWFYTLNFRKGVWTLLQDTPGSIPPAQSLMATVDVQVNGTGGAGDMLGRSAEGQGRWSSVVSWYEQRSGQVTGKKNSLV